MLVVNGAGMFNQLLIMDRLGRKLAYLPSFILLACGMLLIPTTTDYWSLQLVVLLMGFGNGLGALGVLFWRLFF